MNKAFFLAFLIANKIFARPSVENSLSFEVNEFVQSQEEGSYVFKIPEEMASYLEEVRGVFLFKDPVLGWFAKVNEEILSHETTAESNVFTMFFYPLRNGGKFFNQEREDAIKLMIYLYKKEMAQQSFFSKTMSNWLRGCSALTVDQENFDNVAQTTVDYSGLDAKFQELELELAQLRSENEELKEEVVQLKEKNAALEQKNAALEEQIRMLMAQNEALKGKKEFDPALEAENLKLKQNAEKMQAQMQAQMQEKNLQLQAQSEKMKELEQLMQKGFNESALHKLLISSITNDIFNEFRNFYVSFSEQYQNLLMTIDDNFIIRIRQDNDMKIVYFQIAERFKAYKRHVKSFIDDKKRMGQAIKKIEYAMLG